MNKSKPAESKDNSNKWSLVVRNIVVAYFLLVSTFFLVINLIGIYLIIDNMTQIGHIKQFLKDQQNELP